MKRIVILSFITLLAISCATTQRTSPQPKHQAGPSRQMGRSSGKPDAASVINLLDTNKDGKVSKDEAKNAQNGKLYERFSHIDANNDSYLTKEELEKAFQNRPGRR